MERAERRQRRLDIKMFQQNWGGIRDGKKRARSPDRETVDQRVSKCVGCGSDEKELTRAGPGGPWSLCNSCGLEWADKRTKRIARNLQDTTSECDSVEITKAAERGLTMYVAELETRLLDSKEEGFKMKEALEQREGELRASNDELRASKDEVQMLKNDLQKLKDDLKQSEANRTAAEVKNCELETKIHLETETKGHLAYFAEKEMTKLKAKIKLLDGKWEAELQSREVKWKTDISALEEEIRRFKDERRCVEEKYRQVSVKFQLLEHKYSGFGTRCVDFGADMKQMKQDADAILLTLNKDPKDSRSWRSSDVVTDRQRPTPPQYQGSKRASNVVRTDHEEVIADGSDCEVEVDIDTEPDQFERDGGVHAAQGGLGDAGARDGPSVDNLGNGILGKGSEEVQGLGKSRGSNICEKLLVIPLIKHEIARRYVDQDFIDWVNNMLRRPTPEELTYHITNYLENQKHYYWSGVYNYEIINEYQAACASTARRIPRIQDVVTVFSALPNFVEDFASDTIAGGSLPVCVDDSENPVGVSTWHIFSLEWILPFFL
ncbi:hypothetical protein R1flu_018188 [Riccia fluitans]|uniref:GATA-type domain-containing protein n=1 Tax=Riccia fluitans TaxID=41844 RepID=A0ABD1ZGE5_9MARC